MIGGRPRRGQPYRGRVPRPSSYLLCGTPRTGSTLLCSLLASTGVAGRPESYFRAADERTWAARFGVPVADDGSVDRRALVAGALRAGTTPNGVFGARVMWGSVDALVDGLRPGSGVRARSDLDVLDEAMGPLRLVHLRRVDVVQQAVSWARAEQTGYWQQGDALSAEPAFDRDQVDHLLREVREHDAGWRAWFDEQGASPLVVTYEELVADPGRSVRAVLDHLGVEPPAAWRPRSPHRRQADEVSADWVRRYRAASSSGDQGACGPADPSVR